MSARAQTAMEANYKAMLEEAFEETVKDIRKEMLPIRHAALEFAVRKNEGGDLETTMKAARAFLSFLETGK